MEIAMLLSCIIGGVITVIFAQGLAHHAVAAQRRISSLELSTPFHTWGFRIVGGVIAGSAFLRLVSLMIGVDR
jgi:hypothetical protein